MKGEFNWHSYKDLKPKSDLFVYVFDVSNAKDKIDIGKADRYSWKDTYHWCYVYIPDVPERKKLEPCSTLKNCSNDYILELETRIEYLENLIKTFY